MNNTIVELTDREHVLKRPSMYIGGIDLTSSNEYILENNKITNKEVQYVPALVKIINEIIDNSVDIAIKTNFEICNLVQVKIDKTSVEVKDNGTGIPVKEVNGTYMPQIAWGRMRSGSNFTDDDKRTQIGMNGTGSFCTNCFSTSFIGISDDGTKRCTCKFSDNASNCKTTISDSKERGVHVKFIPDLKRFNLTEISDDTINIIKQRLINLNLCFPKLQFKFNGRLINVNSFKKYVSMFSDNFELYETEDYSFAVLHNPNDDFQQFSYVNGLKIPDGGTHIDVISSNIVNRIRDKLVRKYSSIKPGDVKNKLFIIAFLKNVKNTKFSSQTKEKITNSVSEINSYFGDIDWDLISKKILKNEGIIGPITEVYKIKEELKRRQEMKALKKVKRIDNEKYLPPVGDSKYLMIVEGECLEENVEVLKSDFSNVKIKDLKVHDTLLSKDLEETRILGICKNLKPVLTIKTNSGSVTCGYKHRLFVYDTEDLKFKFETAEEISKNTSKYKLVKSNVNVETKGVEVLDNDVLNRKLILEDDYVSYTENDYFMVLSEGKIRKKFCYEIKRNDCILFFID